MGTLLLQLATTPPPTAAAVAAAAAAAAAATTTTTASRTYEAGGEWRAFISLRLVGLKCCFTSTETVGLLGTGAQDVHLDFHTAPEL